MIVSQMPAGTDKAFFYPDIGILLGKGNLRHGILYEDARVWLTVMMHDLTLVIDEILDAQR